MNYLYNNYSNQSKWESPDNLLKMFVGLYNPYDLKYKLFYY